MLRPSRLNRREPRLSRSVRLLEETSRERLLEEVAEAQENEEAREFVRADRELLHRSQENGIEATFAEAEGAMREGEQPGGVRQILEELNRPVQIPDGDANVVEFFYHMSPLLYIYFSV